MRNKRELGPSTTLTILCDGGKMHKLTFYARGPVKLHNHSLRSERALSQLSNNEDHRVPRCLRILATWRQQHYTQGLDGPVYNRLSDALGYRSLIHHIHAHSQACVDADGLDITHEDRLKSIAEDIYYNLTDTISERFKHSPNRYHKPWTKTVGIDITKLRLSIRKRPENVRPAPMLYDLEKLKREHQHV